MYTTYSNFTLAACELSQRLWSFVVKVLGTRLQTVNKSTSVEVNDVSSHMENNCKRPIFVQCEGFPLLWQ